MIRERPGFCQHIRREDGRKPKAAGRHFNLNRCVTRGSENFLDLSAGRFFKRRLRRDRGDHTLPRKRRGTGKPDLHMDPRVRWVEPEIRPLLPDHADHLPGVVFRHFLE